MEPAGRRVRDVLVKQEMINTHWFPPTWQVFAIPDIHKFLTFCDIPSKEGWCIKIPVQAIQQIIRERIDNMSRAEQTRNWECSLLQEALREMASWQSIHSNDRAFDHFHLLMFVT